MAFFEIQNLHVYYGFIHALKGISLTVEEGEIVTLIGANGAGKTTTLRTISGLLQPQEGDVRFNGESLLKYRPHEIVKMGIIHVPEGRRVFARMTVQENLEMGAYVREDKDGIAEDLKRVFKLFPRLEERRGQLAGTLSGGEQQMLAIGRALMSRPRVLLMDEPSMGLAPVLVEEIFDTIKELNETQNLTILLVEQNAHMALQIAHRGYVLETGVITIAGSAQELATNPEVQKAYLGM
ncbi:MAG: ABC transporter ATP-binding protein [Chloroflexi bacterium]|nr:ABC transporter ATP-binding protein [Chloroflexota bacterium]